jgi:hypothetical protein
MHLRLLDILQQLSTASKICGDSLHTIQIPFPNKKLFINAPNLKSLIITCGKNKHVYTDLLNRDMSFLTIQQTDQHQQYNKHCWEFKFKKLDIDSLTKVLFNIEPMFTLNSLNNKDCDILRFDSKHINTIIFKNTLKKCLLKEDNLMSNHQVDYTHLCVARSGLRVFSGKSLFKNAKFMVVDKKPLVKYITNYDEDTNYIINTDVIHFEVNKNFVYKKNLIVIFYNVDIKY